MDEFMVHFFRKHWQSILEEFGDFHSYVELPTGNHQELWG
jgi:hypothetical protein